VEIPSGDLTTAQMRMLAGDTLLQLRHIADELRKRGVRLDKTLIARLENQARG